MSEQATGKEGVDMTPKELEVAAEAISSIKAYYDYFIDRLKDEGYEEVSEWSKEVFLERMMDNITAYIDDDVRLLINDLL
jgi:hypothetical protein